LQVFAVIFILARRHAFDADKQIVQPAGARQSRFETRIGQRMLLPEQLLGMFQADVLQEFLGAHARPFLEQALEMKWTEVHLPGNRIQVGLITEIFGDEPYCFFNTLIVCHEHKNRVTPNP
jgi:hypothetical protein